MVYVPVVCAIWTVVPSFAFLQACFTSDIIDKVCIPLGVYDSVTAEKTVGAWVFVFGYLLPLALMIFCYTRIVYEIRTKVNSTSSSRSFSGKRN